MDRSDRTGGSSARCVDGRVNILLIGGTGNISTAAAQLAMERGFELTLLTRGMRNVSFSGARSIHCAIADEPAVQAAIGNSSFDAVVDWIAYTPADIQRDLRLFRGRTSQYVFISSASCYKKPPDQYLITESTPLGNP